MILVIVDNTYKEDDKTGIECRFYEDKDEEFAYAFCDEWMKIEVLNRFDHWYEFVDEDKELTFKELVDKYRRRILKSPYWFGYDDDTYAMFEFPDQYGSRVRILKIHKTVNEFLKTLEGMREK